ncbi:FAD:protein FMN transferase [Gordonia sp. DT30]|uniref:FAD:protein FMN transferase n=1 Tax=Gordonia sp. DT30 TaxID=3416546 RepID=UPI003CEABBB5
MSRHHVGSSTTFPAIGTSVTVVATVADALAEATALTRRRLTELDRAASRFRADSELAQINSISAALAHTDPHAHLSVAVGRVLAACLSAAVHTERLTDGLVCASLGADLAACGYDDDLAVVRARPAADTENRSPVAAGPPVPHRLTFDEQRRRLTITAGVALDLGASAKAWAADTIAAELARHGKGGFLVNLGGDIAVAGDVPMGGWAIGVRGPDDIDVGAVRGTGQAFATSSTLLRTWHHHGSRQHHIIDPRTGGPAATRWAQITCAAPTAVQANAASTAAIIHDAGAPQWLCEREIPACLISTDRRIITTPGWPDMPDRVPAPDLTGSAMP